MWSILDVFIYIHICIYIYAMEWLRFTEVKYGYRIFKVGNDDISCNKCMQVYIYIYTYIYIYVYIYIYIYAYLYIHK
jgi:hypothetical protein